MKNIKKIAPKFNAFLNSGPVLFLISIFNWPRKKVRQMYDWMIGWAQTRRAEQALGGFSFAESSFFPIPPDPLLIAMTVARPRKYLRFAAICTMFSVLGGIFGYIIGAGLFETVGRAIINAYNLQAEFVLIETRYNETAFLTVFAASFTPVPYKLITISAGVFTINFLTFVIASVIGRGLRFFLVAAVMYYFGERLKDKIKKYIDVLSLIFVILIILGFVAVRYL